MRFWEKAFNDMVDAMRWILRLEPASAVAEKVAEAYRKRGRDPLRCQAVKVMTRSNAQERIRIVRQGQDFGAILDFRHPQYGWSAEHILCAGIVYESPEVAEAQARDALSGITDWKEEPVRLSEPDRVERDLRCLPGKLG